MSKKRKTKKRILQNPIAIAAGAIILSLILLATTYYASKNTNIAPRQIYTYIPDVSPTPTSENSYPSPIISHNIKTITIERLNMDNWQTYKNEIYGYSFKYPPTWTMSKVQYAPQNSKNAHGFTLKGAEGNITVTVGNGFGGGCNEEDHKYITLFNEQKNICSGIDNKNEQYWSQIYESFGEDTMSISASANPPFDKNSQTVLSILSSFEK